MGSFFFDCSGSPSFLHAGLHFLSPDSVHSRPFFLLFFPCLHAAFSLHLHYRRSFSPALSSSLVSFPLFCTPGFTFSLLLAFTLGPFSYAFARRLVSTTGVHSPFSSSPYHWPLPAGVQLTSCFP